MNARTACKMIREASEACLLDGKQEHEAGDEDMAEMYDADGHDLMLVEQHCWAGRYQQALDHAGGMDTAARGKIPQIVHDFLIEQIS